MFSSARLSNTPPSARQLLLRHRVRLQLLAGTQLPGGGASRPVLLGTLHRPAVHGDLRGQNQSHGGGKSQVCRVHFHSSFFFLYALFIVFCSRNYNIHTLSKPPAWNSINCNQLTIHHRMALQIKHFCCAREVFSTSYCKGFSKRTQIF